MAVLTLLEAAEQAGTSKVDVWRAIREGRLPAHRTDDGGYAIEPAELFRVFETKPPEPRLAQPDATAASEAKREAEAVEASATAATDDVSVAFAALQTELTSLLGPLAEALRAGANRHANTHDERAESPPVSLAERNIQLEAELVAERARAGKAIAECAALADQLAAQDEARRPWWRRLLG